MSDHLTPRPERSRDQSSHDDLLRALTGCDLQEELTVSRTRRVVHGAVINMEEQKANRRKKTGMVLMASALFLTLLAPALWSSVDCFVAGDHFGDLQTQMYLLGVMLFPGIVAAAIAGFARQRPSGRQI